MRRRRVCWIERWCLEIVLRYACSRVRVQHLTPAHIRVQKAPPYTVLPHLLHPSAPIQESRQHTLPQLNDTHVLLRFRRLGRIVRYTVLLGYGRDDERRMQAYQSVSQRREFAVPSPHLNLASLYGVGNKATAAFGVLASSDDLYLQLRVLV